MIPLHDNIPPRTFPFINYLMIATCALAFFAQLADQSDGEDHLVDTFGMIPARVVHPQQTFVAQREVLVRTGRGVERRVIEHEYQPLPFSPWWTLLTCVFLHGGWMHFLGNMWFLHIFGDNVEDRFGHVGYAIFYLASGVAASVSHLMSAPQSTMPTIGASGAIAGVMGAYLLLYPHARVLTLIPLFAFLQTAVIPAPVFLVFWFVLQSFQGVASITAKEAGGVAWWAHIGGFAVGFVCAWILKQTGYLRPPVETRLAPNARTPYYHFRQPPGI